MGQTAWISTPWITLIEGLAQKRGTPGLSWNNNQSGSQPASTFAYSQLLKFYQRPRQAKLNPSFLWLSTQTIYTTVYKQEVIAVLYIKNMSTEIARKIIEQVRASQCRKKNCVSQQRDPLEVVWFGKQYGVNREATCSACYICNDEAVKNSLPTHLNVLPLSLFIEQFTKEMKQYQQIKASKDFFPKVIREKGKLFLADLQKTEIEVTETLNQLASAIVGFCKKVEEANAKIFRHETFEELIAMNSDNKFEALLEKIVRLIEMLNFGADEGYHFEDIELRDKKIAKLKELISGVTLRTTTTLDELFTLLKEKNDLISKI